MKITVYKVLVESGVKFSRLDGMKIGETVFWAWQMESDEVPKKVEQIENGKKFFVYEYPDSFRDVIERVIVRFYANLMGEKKKYSHELARTWASEK